MCYDPAVKRWHAVFTALLFFVPPGARAAEDVSGAVRELARKTAAFAGKGAAVSVTWRNVSSLGSSEVGRAGVAFETALTEAGVRMSEWAPAAELRITISEDPSQYLLVEEARKGDQRQVWIASWKRTEAAVSNSGVTLDKKLIWRQDEQILDLAVAGDNMLVLSPTRLTLYARQNGQWESKQEAAVITAKPWPRDLRGRLRMNGTRLQAWLPGMTCGGATDPALSLECRPGEEPWVLESGTRAMILANFAPARNHFDGHITTQTGVPKTVGPFFSAASVEEQGRTLWLLAMVNGRTQIFDAAFDTVGGVSGWGSDIVGTEARCGGGSQVLATRAGDASEPDGLQAFAVIDRAAAPLAGSVDFPGPVTALWPAGATTVLAIARDLTTGGYAAYVVTVVCGG